MCYIITRSYYYTAVIIVRNTSITAVMEVTIFCFLVFISVLRSLIFSVLLSVRSFAGVFTYYQPIIVVSPHRF